MAFKNTFSYVGFDLKRTTKATGATIPMSTNGIFEGMLGSCTNFYEKQVGDERFSPGGGGRGYSIDW